MMTSIVILFLWVIIGAAKLIEQTVYKGNPSWVDYWLAYAMVILGILARFAV